MKRERERKVKSEGKEGRERVRERVQTDGPPREIASLGWEALLPTFLPRAAFAKYIRAGKLKTSDRPA